MRAALALSLVLCCGQGTAQDGHNVLLIVADDLGVDFMRSYGAKRPARTPAIDKLAASGVRFRSAWACAMCSPTRACLMTGRYGFRTGVGSVRGRGPRLRSSEVTIPEVLDTARAGYAHALIGKWHLGSAADDRGPNDAGWGHFAGLLPAMVRDYYSWPRTVNGRTETCEEYSTVQITSDALDWIKRQDGPWLCIVNYNAPHSPFQEPPPELHSEDLDMLGDGRNTELCYRAMVEAMDTQIARMLAGLGSKRSQTNVIFLGDNGSPGQVAPAARGRAKTSPYQGGVHVPLIVAGPAVQSPGRDVDAIVGAVDLFATLIELAGVEVRDHVTKTTQLDAVSLVPYLRDPTQKPLRRFLLTEMFHGDPDSTGFVACRNARYKWIRNTRTSGVGARGRGRRRFGTRRRFGGSGNRQGTQPTEELYDLVADPEETRNLLRAELNAEQRRNLEALRAETRRLRASR